MAGELGLGKLDLERRFAASLLRSGASMEEAQRLATILAHDFHKEFTGKRVTIRVDRDHMRMLSPEDRRRIYLTWWVEQTEDHILCTDNHISLTTLKRIKRDGKRLNWAARR